MKLIDVDCLFEKSKIIFYFTAGSRVDFRELVKDLVQRFKIRIELKQIGARQETRITKGIGICGRMVCCAGILQNWRELPSKWLKNRACRLIRKNFRIVRQLMCCLAFEHEGYAGQKKCPRAAKANSNEAQEDKQTMEFGKDG